MKEHPTLREIIWGTKENFDAWVKEETAIKPPQRMIVSPSMYRRIKEWNGDSRSNPRNVS